MISAGSHLSFNFSLPPSSLSLSLAFSSLSLISIQSAAAAAAAAAVLFEDPWQQDRRIHPRHNPPTPPQKNKKTKKQKNKKTARATCSLCGSPPACPCWRASRSRWTWKVAKRRGKPGISWKMSNGCQPSPSTAGRSSTGIASETWVVCFCVCCFVLLYYPRGLLLLSVLSPRRCWMSAVEMERGGFGAQVIFFLFFFFFLRTVDWAQTHAQHEQFVRKKNTWDDQTLCLMTWLIHQHQLFLSPPTPLLRSHSFAADTPSLKLALLSMDRLMRELPSGVACDVTVSVFTDQYPLICHIAHTQCKAASDRKSHSETDIASVFPPDQTSSRKGNKHFFLPCRAAVQTSLGCGVTALFILRAARYKWPMNWTNLCINFPSLWLSEFGHLLVPSVRQEIKLLGFVRLSAIS